MKTTTNKQFILAAAFGIAILFNAGILTAQTKPVLEPVGTHAILGKLDGINIEGMVQSPSNQKTPLQIICVFEYAEGDITSPQALPAAANGLVHVDQQMRGLLTELRKSGKFKGEALETILLTPPKGMLSAQRLLIIGLGRKDSFNPDLMISVGRIGMRAALSLGVTSYSHASDLKDGGVDSPTALIATNVVKGAFEAYETDQYLQSKHLTGKKMLNKITMLAGQAFFDPSGTAIKSFIQTYRQ